MKPFKIPRHLPPEFRALPLDLLRRENWPVWPEKIARGFAAYPSPNLTPLPVSADRDPISNAKQAVEHVLSEHARMHAYSHAMRPVGDTPVGKAVKNARYAGMEENSFYRSNPPQQSVPWIDHTGIWSRREAVAEFMRRSIYPNLPAGVVAEFLASFERKSR